MIKFAVLSIKDIVNKAVLIAVICIVGVIGINMLNNVNIYKRYIVNVIPTSSTTNSNMINAYVRNILVSEIPLLNVDVGILEKNIENINSQQSEFENDTNTTEIEKEKIPIGVTDLKIEDINNKKYNIINNVDKISIKNKTTYKIDYNKLVSSNLNLFEQNKMPTILIIHTHGSESYTGVEHTDYFRNESIDKNMIRVGKELADILTNSGYDVIHDTRLYDFPTYSGSYTRALSSIEEYIQNNTNVQIVLDIHRDALASDENFAPSANIDGNKVSQISIIAGTSEGGLSHPNWEENLKLALQLYNTAYQVYPDMFRPLTITKSRYNQHATKGSLILEVGATGNTLDESILSMRYFAKILDETLKNI